MDNKQVVIIDTNNDFNFEDETKTEYPIGFSYSHNEDEKLLKAIDTITIRYEYYKNDAIANIIRKVKIYPNTNSVFNYLIDMAFINNQLNNYTLVLQLIDYNYGKLKINNVNYNIAVQGLNRDRAVVYLEPDSLLYVTPKDNTFQKNFAYNIGDTARLSNKQFSINIDDDMSNLTLSNIENNVLKYGYRMGFEIENQQLISLNNETFNLKEIISKDGFTLLDFWGTWCKPCKKTLPKIKQIDSLYNDRLTLVGIALDDEMNVVKNYTTKNNMKWYQFFVDRNDRMNTIITNLKIVSYPTFILLDNNGKILVRGGSESMEYIEKIIQK